MTETNQDPEKPDHAEPVRDIPPANPFNEPIPDDLSTGEGAEITQATIKPAETVVEYPLSPTDTNPNPHGNRDEPFVKVVGADGEVSEPEEGPVQIEATHESSGGLHLGDGRVLQHGERAKVSKEVAKQLVDSKQAKRVR